MNESDWGTIIRSLNVLTMAVRDLQNRIEAVEKSCNVLDYRTNQIGKYKKRRKKSPSGRMTNCDTPRHNTAQRWHTPRHQQPTMTLIEATNNGTFHLTAEKATVGVSAHLS